MWALAISLYFYKKFILSHMKHGRNLKCVLLKNCRFFTRIFPFKSVSYTSIDYDTMLLPNSIVGMKVSLVIVHGAGDQNYIDMILCTCACVIL